MGVADTSFLICFIGFGTVFCILGLRQVVLDLEAWQANKARYAPVRHEQMAVNSLGPRPALSVMQKSHCS